MHVHPRAGRSKAATSSHRVTAAVPLRSSRRRARAPCSYQVGKPEFHACGNLDDRAGWLCQPPAGRTWSKESVMSVYRVTEIIGTSSTSWEEAAAEAIRTAAGTLHDLRVAEVVKQDIHLDQDGAITYRTKLQLSFKYEPGN